MPKNEKDTEKKVAGTKPNGRQTKGNNGKPSNKSGKTADTFKGKQKSTGSAVALSATQLITSANFGYGYPLGTSISDIASKKGVAAGKTLGMPSIAAYYVHPHIGRSDSSTSKVNLAAHRLYTSFVYANGRTPGYDVPDALLSPLAVGQCAAFYHHACRVYRTMNTFLTDNREIPQALAAVELIDYHDFEEHLADFMHWLEDYRLMLKTLFLPGNLPIIDEWCSVFDDVYLDDGYNPKAQLFLFVPEGFYKYNPTLTTEGGGLEYIPYAVWNTQVGQYSRYTFSAFKEYGDALIGALIYDQDVNKIQADIMLSYGPNSVAETNGVELGGALEFKLNGDVLSTLHNASVFSGLTQVTQQNKRNIIQNENGEIVYTPVWQGTKDKCLPIIGGKFFDSPTADVNPLWNAMLLRMAALAPNAVQTASGIFTTPGYYFENDVPDGYVHPSAVGVYTINDTAIVKGQGDVYPYQWGIWYPYNSPGVTATSQSDWYNSMMPVFNMHPLYEKYATMSSATLKAARTTEPFTLDAILGEICYYTILDEATVRQILDTYIFAQLSAGLTG